MTSGNKPRTAQVGAARKARTLNRKSLVPQKMMTFPKKIVKIQFFASERLVALRRKISRVTL